MSLPFQRQPLVPNRRKLRFIRVAKRVRNTIKKIEDQFFLQQRLKTKNSVAFMEEFVQSEGSRRYFVAYVWNTDGVHDVAMEIDALPSQCCLVRILQGEKQMAFVVLLSVHVRRLRIFRDPKQLRCVLYSVERSSTKTTLASMIRTHRDYPDLTWQVKSPPLIADESLFAIAIEKYVTPLLV